MKKLLAVLLMSAAALRAQEVFRAESREVVVDVTVTDGKGVPVQGLTKDDFSITDEGKPRTISGFSTATDFKPISGLPTPLHPPEAGSAGGGPSVVGHSTAIILDEVNSYFEDAAQARKNVLDVMAKVPADERIALYAIVRHQGLLLLQDYTTDRDTLRHALEKHQPSGMRPGIDLDEPPLDLRTHTRKAQDLVCADKMGLSPAEATGGDQNLPPWGSPLVNCSELLDAWQRNADDARLSLQTLAEQLSLFPGRKSIFWITEAFPRWLLRGAYESAWDKTFHALNEANAAVNTIDTRGLIPYGEPATGAISTMIQIAENTGGKAYFNRNDIDGALQDAIAASRVIYTLRFAIPDSERDKRFHVLKVKVDRPGVQVYARQGYYAGGEEKPDDLITPKIEGAALEATVANATAVTPLKAFVGLPYFYTGANRASVHLALQMADPSILKGQTEIVAVALRPDGAEASRFADTIAPDSGGRYEHAFTLAAGTYNLRITVGSGASVIGVKEVPLTIAPWSTGTFGMGQIALSIGAPAVSGPPETGALIAANREFTPVAHPSFQKSDRVYLYTEFNDAANPSALTMQFRVLDAATGAIKFDGPKGSVASFVRAGNPAVPVATIVPFAQLTPGSYRLEVAAGHAGAGETLTRSIDFEIRP
ncbi:MAG TPA: VWA domain-containing protein [Bryobacteraceae bacterium]|nr:VWA domain-containing protein [Bryobacteraceae bacterium]